MRIANFEGVNLKRKGPSKEPIKKYFIVVEGDKTEHKYFNGIKDNREEIGINSLIDIYLLENEGNIDKAIVNEKKFEESTFQLENKLGSNVGRLIEDMKRL